MHDWTELLISVFHLFFFSSMAVGYGISVFHLFFFSSMAFGYGISVFYFSFFIDGLRIWIPRRDAFPPYHV